MTIVDIGVACNKYQTPEWSQALTTELLISQAQFGIQINRIIFSKTALPDLNKNNAAETLLRNRIMTDDARNMVMGKFYNGKADFIYWLDDDTAHPAFTLKRLLDIGEPFVSGLYFLKDRPTSPIAYKISEDGGYKPITDFQLGEIVQADSVGMGCALIHRAVYEGIVNTHDVYRRDNGSCFALAKSARQTYIPPKDRKVIEKYANLVTMDGIFLQHVEKLDDEGLEKYKLRWPFYVMEYMRTEDHYFCEMAATAGFKPLVDTSIVCQHYGEKAFGIHDWNEERLKALMGLKERVESAHGKAE